MIKIDEGYYKLVEEHDDKDVDWGKCHGKTYSDGIHHFVMYTYVDHPERISMHPTMVSQKALKKVFGEHACLSS